MMSSSTEDTVIKKRLAIEGDSGQDDKRLAGLLKTFLKWCASDNLSQEENEATHQKILFALSQVKFSFSRTEQVVSMNQLEEERYDKLSTQVQEDIKNIQQHIVDLKQDLVKAREVRQHRQEYDAMATIIQKHPDRDSSETEISSLKDNFKKVNSRIDDLTEKLEQRRKQSSVLVLAIQQILDSLDEDSTDSNGTTEIPMETN